MVIQFVLFIDVENFINLFKVVNLDPWVVQESFMNFQMGECALLSSLDLLQKISIHSFKQEFFAVEMKTAVRTDYVGFT